jgi:pimeloyl-ACP methyl ester carboxylesterase
MLNEIQVNGTSLPYIDEGAGEPVIFVHGAISDLRVWEPVKEAIAAKYRFIAYTQRYFGTSPWNDGGEQFSVATLADDLTKFIASLNVGPVHLVGWSFGGQVATAAAVKTPSLIRSLILYEASIMSVLAETSAEGKMAREDRAKMLGPAAEASKAGDAVRASRLVLEAIFQLPPGGSYSESQAFQIMCDENARTTPLLLAAAPPDITCEMFKNFNRPTLVMWGEKTRPGYVLIAEAVTRCVPIARQIILANVNHDGPYRDPKGFSATILGFLSEQS